MLEHVPRTIFTINSEVDKVIVYESEASMTALLMVASCAWLPNGKAVLAMELMLKLGGYKALRKLAALALAGTPETEIELSYVSRVNTRCTGINKPNCITLFLFTRLRMLARR